MIKAVFLCISCISFTVVDCMDVPLSQCDYFSPQPNTVRRIFIFPLLKDCATVQEVRQNILAIALVSKKSYRQMKAPFFLKDMIRLIGEQFAQSDMDSVKMLNSALTHTYTQMSEKMMLMTDIRKFPYAPLNEFFHLLNHGAPINCTFSDYNVTLLMRAVYINRFDLVKLFVHRGADITAYIHHKKDDQKRKLYYVRDCNMIYNPEKLYACAKAKEVKKLSVALYIDKFLETRKAPSGIAIANNYLANELVEEAKKHHKKGYGTVLSCLYSDDKDMVKKCVPHDIAQALCLFIDGKNNQTRG